VCTANVDADAGERTTETAELRKKVLLGCEQTIWEYFEGGGQVVIYDANNGTREARNTLAEKFDKQGIHVIMLGASGHAAHPSAVLLTRGRAESVCDDSEVIERNIRSVKISSPDVSPMSPLVGRSAQVTDT
jgi:6-phosphofructo-2-kinase/fructose-2,6-biphosphatase 4